MGAERRGVRVWGVLMGLPGGTGEGALAEAVGVRDAVEAQRTV